MNSNLEKLMEKASTFILERVPNSYGLFRTESFDVHENVWSTEMCDPDDFGDFAPFMVWRDIVLDKTKNIEFVGSQFDRLQRILRQRSGLYYPFSSGQNKVSQSSFSVIYPQNHVDFILGSSLIYMLLGEKKYLDASEGACTAIERHALSRNGFVYAAVIPAFNLYYPKYGYLRHKPVVSGVFIEEFCNVHELSSNEKYLDAAKTMARAWIETPTFRKHGICCDQVYPIINREATNLCTIGKMNSNFSDGLIRLAEVSKDDYIIEAAEKNLEGMQLFSNAEGAYHLTVDSKTGKVINNGIYLVQNHMFMGSLLDAFEAFGKRSYMKRAQSCMDYWLERHSDNGLFKMRGERVGNWRECDIDTHADILTVLSRLYMLTGKNKYRDAIKKGVEAYSLFETKDTFYRLVDLKTGKALSTKNELKFIGGLMKGLMSTYTVLKRTKKIDSGMLRLLMRDR